MDHLGETPALVERQSGGGDVEVLILKSRSFGEAVPRRSLGEVARQRPAADIKMSDTVLGNRIAAGGGDEKDLGGARLRLWLRHPR